MTALVELTWPMGQGKEAPDPAWAACRFLTCSVLPVRLACNLRCPFCFSKSSLSALAAERVDWARMDVESYYAFARAKGATRLVITGGGEPLLRADDVVRLIARARPYFGEIACFTNGALLDRALAERLAEAGLSYLCWSRHALDDEENVRLMGPGAPRLSDFFLSARPLKVRATCVMVRGHVDSKEKAWAYAAAMAEHGVRELTFKHTYVAYPQSVFAGSPEDRWAEAHRLEEDPFAGEPAEVLFSLPWGPRVIRARGLQVCFYREPTPAWEKEHGLCRSSNLLSDGSVYASLEDRRSLLYRLPA